MISSKRGSEYNVAWNHLRHLEKYYTITLIFGTNGKKIGELVDDDDLFTKSRSEKIFIPSDRLIELLNAPNNYGLFKYSFYWAYKRWQKKAYNYCLENKVLDRIDLIHFLNPIGFREPGYWFLCSKPLFWGPIGGFPKIPYYKKTLPLKEFFLNQVNYYHRTKSRVRKSIEVAQKVYAATLENKYIIDSYFKIDSVYLPENAIENELIAIDSSRFLNPEVYNVVWIGSLEKRKQFSLFQDAVLKIKRKDIYFHIIGVHETPKLSDLSHVKFYPKISRQEVFKVLDKCHLNVVTSLREGNPTVIWESAARGVPTLSLSNSGMKDTLINGLGNLIPNETSSEDLKIRLIEILNKKSLLKLHDEVKGSINDYSWENRVRFWKKEYDTASKDILQKS